MALEFRREHVILRVDGDVLEIARPGSFSERVPLVWLVVQVQPSARGRLLLRLASADGDQPLYEVLPKAATRLGDSVDVIIGANDEPMYREFFAEVSRLCDRPVVN
jgi:hypothetical protein